MHASTLLTTLLTLGTALATPLPATSNTTTTNQLVRRTNSCLAEDGAAKLWRVTLDNDAAHNKQCGTGCLDNIRGRPLCHEATSWTCKRDAKTGTATYEFATTTGCTLWDMTQALKSCSGETIDCYNGEVQ